jgi:hypothetical protein
MRSIVSSMHHRAVLVGSLAVVVSCSAAPDPEDADDTQALISQAHTSTRGAAVGGGQYAIADLAVQFSLVAIELGGESAIGVFHHKTSYDGLTADFKGRVICLAVDSTNSRAWIGGVVTRNDSTDPDYAAPIYQPGRDVWFRVVDYGSGTAEPDRTTFVGFEGAAGIITSRQYCQARLWPDADARTWPVTSGNILVKP